MALARQRFRSGESLDSQYLLGAKGMDAMSKKRKQANNHMGSSIDDFLKEEGIFEETQAQAVIGR